MKHILTDDFLLVCNRILDENKTLEQWALIESDDMFQEGDYVGGFDATEMEFCFSVTENSREYWFQLSLQEIEEISTGKKNEVEARLADF